MNITTRCLILSLGLLAAAPTPEETHTGCVMQTEAGWFTFCEPNNCSVIKGTGVDAKLSGHKVTATGRVEPATAKTGRTFVVSKIIKVGEKCDEICSPNPPSHRGIGGKDKPGAEGGTPGVVAPPPNVPHS